MKSIFTEVNEALDCKSSIFNVVNNLYHSMSRKLLISSVVFLTIGVSQAVAQQAVAVLHHNGTITSYSPTRFSDAFTNASEGDTIYISEGIVHGDINLYKKPLTIIGAGLNTIVEGDVIVSDHCKVYNMEITGTVRETGSSYYIQVSQCKIGDVNSPYGSEHVVYDRCMITSFYLAPNFSDLNVIGCKIGLLQGYNEADRITFTNCNIKLVDFSSGGSCEATYVNSIIGGFNGQGTSNKTTYVNCLLHSLETDGAISSAIKQNCWYNEDFSIDDDVNCSYTDGELSSKGYKDENGEVVGCTGGVAPFTLTPAAPRVLTHSISVDNQNKMLNVTLTIGNGYEF